MVLVEMLEVCKGGLEKKGGRRRERVGEVLEKSLNNG
jgi:hypothetical protein